MTYAEKLLDPRWQRKRLQIMERDDFACRNCGDKNQTLHVHHTEYHEDKNPWEYDDVLLKTLCSHCHTLIHYLNETQTERPLLRTIKKTSSTGFIHFMSFFLNANNTITTIVFVLTEYGTIEIPLCMGQKSMDEFTKAYNDLKTIHGQEVH